MVKLSETILINFFLEFLKYIQANKGYYTEGLRRSRIYEKRVF